MVALNPAVQAIGIAGANNIRPPAFVLACKIVAALSLIVIVPAALAQRLKPTKEHAVVETVRLAF